MPGLLALAPAAFATLLTMSRARRDAALLRQFSDAHLEDIGLTQADIGRVARGATARPER